MYSPVIYAPPDPAECIMGISVAQAFGTLRAEDEPWLDSCFVPPSNLERIRNNQSIVIFGSVGAGKTAIYEMLKQQNLNKEGEPQRLLLDWRIGTPIAPVTEPTSSVANQVNQLFDLCAVGLAQHIADYPHRFSEAPKWAKERINWFIQTYLQQHVTVRLGHLLDSDRPGVAQLRQLLDSQPPPLLYPDPAPQLVLTELGLALAPLGLQGVWFMVDDIERLAPIDEELTGQVLQALLATLPLLERTEFAFKLFVPARLEGAISRASGFERRRIFGVRLQWTEGELRQIVEQRLRLVTEDDTFHLGKLYNEKALLSWLNAAGGESPRHWLDQVEPLIADYLQNQRTTPMNKQTWKKIREAHPPQFYFFKNDKRVIVGGREMTLNEVPPNAVSMLEYLFEHGNRIVPRENLYYLAHQKQAHIPEPSDKGYESPKDYTGTLDTAIWRLRKAIEPDPQMPVLIKTKRGHGILLHVRW